MTLYLPLIINAVGGSRVDENEMVRGIGVALAVDLCHRGCDGLHPFAADIAFR